MPGEILNAIVTSVTLGVERGSFLDSWVFVDFGNGGAQGFGGFALYPGQTAKHHRIDSPAGHWIWRVMQVAGVENWRDVVGKAIRCRIAGNGQICAIGHITKDDWFHPAEDFMKNDGGAHAG